jgi:L-rhamnose mutarotase
MEGYQTRHYDIPVKRYCRTLELKDDKELISLYRKYHSKEFHWPEIRKGIRAVGILEMEIYINDNKLFMIVDAPIDFDWDDAMTRLATLPRQAEWEEFVARFQVCDPKATSNGKWKFMERMFYLYDE